MDYETLVKLGIKEAYERSQSTMRKLHISVLYERMCVKYPNFIRCLYLELFDDTNYDEYGTLISCEYRFKLCTLIKTLESKYNIKIYGHKEIWRGFQLDMNDIKYVLCYVLSEKFIQISPLLYKMIDNGILKTMDEWGE